MLSLIKIFRLVSSSEAISYLILLFVGMPLKYMADKPLMVEIMGPIHGVLFIAYVIGALFVARELNWTKKQLAISLFCSILPFGPFYVEKQYLPKTS